MPARHKTRLPAPGFAALDLPVRNLPLTNAFRVHSKTRNAISFRLNPNHRFSHRMAPENVLYAAEDVETCLWECFGDEILDPGAMVSASRWLGSMLSKITVLRPLRVCDLTETDVRRSLSLDLSAINSTDLSVPQRWALAIQTHPTNVDGLRYPSRFTNRPCLALFDRPGLARLLGCRPIASLSSLPEADAFLTHNQIHLV